MNERITLYLTPALFKQLQSVCKTNKELDMNDLICRGIKEQLLQLPNVVVHEDAGASTNALQRRAL